MRDEHDQGVAVPGFKAALEAHGRPAHAVFAARERDDARQLQGDACDRVAAHDQVAPDKGGSLYSKDAALHSVAKLSQLGYDCHIVECDLESIREPIGFPTDLSNGVPTILLASKLNIFGIAYGTVLGKWDY